MLLSYVASIIGLWLVGRGDTVRLVLNKADVQSPPIILLVYCDRMTVLVLSDRTGVQSSFSPFVPGSSLHMLIAPLVLLYLKIVHLCQITNSIKCTLSSIFPFISNTGSSPWTMLGLWRVLPQILLLYNSEIRLYVCLKPFFYWSYL